MFSFDNAFELHNDIDVLKKMGLDCGLHSASCSAENLKHAKSMLPKAFGEILDGKMIITVHRFYFYITLCQLEYMPRVLLYNYICNFHCI